MYSNLLLNRRMLLEFLFTIHTNVSTIWVYFYQIRPLLTTFNIEWQDGVSRFFHITAIFCSVCTNAMCGDGIDRCLQPHLIHWINFLHSFRERERTFSNFSVSVVMFQSSASQICRQTQCYGEKWDEFGEINLVCGFRQFELFLHHWKKRTLSYCLQMDWAWVFILHKVRALHSLCDSHFTYVCASLSTDHILFQVWWHLTFQGRLKKRIL